MNPAKFRVVGFYVNSLVPSKETGDALLLTHMLRYLFVDKIKLPNSEQTNTGRIQWQK
jgi:hypothetical protein